jgi:hypothetical protein
MGGLGRHWFAAPACPTTRFVGDSAMDNVSG